MKLLLLALTLSLSSCAVDWKSLAARAGQAALDASAPIVIEGVTSKPRTSAKQPVNVNP